MTREFDFPFTAVERKGEGGMLQARPLSSDAIDWCGWQDSQYMLTAKAGTSVRGCRRPTISIVKIASGCLVFRPSAANFAANGSTLYRQTKLVLE